MISNFSLPFNYSVYKTEKKEITDHRTFKPHEIKEFEIWNWRSLKNEKWFVYLDCDTKKFRKWKLK